MEAMYSAVLLAVAVLGIMIIIKLFKKPIKLIFKLGWNTVMGFLSLMLINFVGSFVGIPQIEITAIRALLVGILGVPGTLLLIILQFV